MSEALRMRETGKGRRLYTRPYYVSWAIVSLAGKTNNERMRELAVESIEYI